MVLVVGTGVVVVGTGVVGTGVVVVQGVVVGTSVEVGVTVLDSHGVVHSPEGWDQLSPRGCMTPARAGLAARAKRAMDWSISRN